MTRQVEVTQGVHRLMYDPDHPSVPLIVLHPRDPLWRDVRDGMLWGCRVKKSRRIRWWAMAWWCICDWFGYHTYD